MDSETVRQAPGRPREFDADEVSDRLLTLFWERGYDRVSQQQIVAETGISTSSLYNAFGNKPDLYAEALRRYVVVADRLFKPLEHGTGGFEDLEAFLDLVETHLHGPMGPCGCLVIVTATTFLDPDDTISELTQGYLQRLSDALEAALSRAAVLEPNAPDPAVARPLLMASTLGIWTMARATSAGPETFNQINAARALIASWKGEG